MSKSKKSTFDKTLLQSQATMFADGDKGYFSQSHQCFYGTEHIPLSFTVTGNMGKGDTKRTFHATANGKIKDFDELDAALEYIGFKLA